VLNNTSDNVLLKNGDANQISKNKKMSCTGSTVQDIKERKMVLNTIDPASLTHYLLPSKSKAA